MSEKTVMVAQVKVNVPKAVRVVVGFDGSVKTVFEDDDHIEDYDLGYDECLARFVLDESTELVVAKPEEGP
jgi:hypothetical protein